MAHDLQHEETIAFDLDAYMEQAQMVLDGERNYTAIRGDTGPLVYPAGHVLVYGSILKLTGWNASHWTTEYSPKDIPGYEGRTHRPHALLFRLQCVFAAAYTLTLGIWLYFITRIMPSFKWQGAWKALDYGARLLTILVGVLKGRRARQVFALGLFNDAVAATVIAVALLLLSRRRWLAGCVLYSFAVAIKMNNLLFAPGLAVLLMHYTGWRHSLGYIAACAAVQVGLGAPFLLQFPREYVMGAFNLGRQFEQQWSVNFVFLPEAVFSSKLLAVGLLAATVACLGFMRFTVCALARKPPSKADRARRADVLFPGRHPTSPFTGPCIVGNTGVPIPAETAARVIEHHILLVLASSNIVGVVLARSIHFQFFVWYWHAVLLHAVSSRVTGIFWPVWGYFFMRFWEFHPPTELSSGIVFICHALLLLSMAWGWNTSVPGLQQLQPAFHYISTLGGGEKKRV